MKKIEVNGLSGLHIEIYDKHDNFTDMEMMKEAEKAIRRAVLFIESGGRRDGYRANPSTSGESSSNVI